MTPTECITCFLLAYSVVMTAMFINKEWFNDGQE